MQQGYFFFPLPSALIILFSFFTPATADVFPHPQVLGSTTSSQFSVNSAKQNIWVEQTEAEHYAKLSCSQNTEIEVTDLSGKSAFVVRPEHLVRDVQKQGNRIRFTLIQPRTVFVETEDATLLVIASALSPRAALGKVSAKVYGPGTHNVGELNIGTGTLEIQAGAILKGRIVGSGSAKIFGTGTIDGASSTEGGTPVIELEGGSGGSIEGITVRGAVWWAVVPTKINGFTVKDVTITNCKKDGLDLLSCQNLKVINCTIKTPDDAIAIKNLDPMPTKNLLVEGCTLAGTPFGDGLTVGFEMKKGDIGFITVRNCHILQGKGGNAVGGHSGFSIIADGPAPVHDILFENIIVEADVTKNFEIQITAGNLYPKFGTGVGSVKDVTLKNITWKASKAIILKGRDATHLIENVHFDNCTVNGKLLKSTSDADFTVNQFVKGVRFTGGTTGICKPFSSHKSASQGFDFRLDKIGAFRNGNPPVISFNVNGKSIKPLYIKQC